MDDFRFSADYFLWLSAIFRRMHFMLSSSQCRSGRTRLVRFGDIAWTALKASEKIRKPFESWIKALGNKGGPFLRDEFSATPKTQSISPLEWTSGFLDPRCFRVLLGEIENLDLDAAPGEGGDGMAGLVCWCCLNSGCYWSAVICIYRWYNYIYTWIAYLLTIYLGCNVRIHTCIHMEWTFNLYIYIYIIHLHCYESTCPIPVNCHMCNVAIEDKCANPDCNLEYHTFSAFILFKLPKQKKTSWTGLAQAPLQTHQAAMGMFFSKIWSRMVSTKDMRILMLGLDAAGKTTILYRFKLAEVIHTVPTIGFNVETVEYKNIKFDA